MRMESEEFSVVHGKMQFAPTLKSASVPVIGSIISSFPQKDGQFSPINCLYLTHYRKCPRSNSIVPVPDCIVRFSCSFFSGNDVVSETDRLTA